MCCTGGSKPRLQDVHSDHLSHLTFMAYIPFASHICICGKTINGPDKAIVQRGESGMPNLGIHDMNPKRTWNIRCTTEAIETEEWKNHNPNPHVQYSSLCTIQIPFLHSTHSTTSTLQKLILPCSLLVDNIKTPLAYTYSCCLQSQLVRGRFISRRSHEGAWCNQGDPQQNACRGNPLCLRVTHYWANQLMAYSVCIGVLHQDATSISRGHVGSACR
ncbi:hypothetical protein VNO77_22913 [Canavalia gladiata]|uniref:Uncharacterized protein n=1 Tax=Canavalia gladiata TaxID=3824 RepID=A0AAN9QB11_CANGL